LGYREFAIWLKGFSKSIKTKPTKKQWEDILSTLKEVMIYDATITKHDKGLEDERLKRIRDKDFPGKPPDIFF